MSKKNDDEEQILWKDRKRWLGMPLSFTKYAVAENRLLVSKGFWSTETDETLLYRILDIKLKRTFGQKIFGVGTITLYSADQSNHVLELKNIKRPDAVRRFLSKIVEQERSEKGLVGHEMLGVAHSDGPDGHRARAPHHDFIDVDGDGIPD